MTIYPHRPRAASLQPWLRRGTVLAAVGLSAALLAAAPAGAEPVTQPGSTPVKVGAAVPAGCRTGLGDRVHPHLGTPGVRIRGYTTVLTFAPGLRTYGAATSVRGTVAQRQPLRCLALDFSRGTVRPSRCAGTICRSG